MARVLLVDDEMNVLLVLACMLKSKKHEVVTTTDGQKAIDTLKAENFDLLISDIRMNPVDGMTVLKSARASKPDMPVLMLTAYGSQETAQAAVQFGAFGFILKPFNLQELLIMVQRALDHTLQPKDAAVPVAPAVPAQGRYPLDDFVAESAASKQLSEQIKHAAAVESPVLICGDHGTGKSLVARTIHLLSLRKQREFITLNCANLPEPLLDLEMFGYVRGAFASAKKDKKGILEAAWGSTAVFDEIGWMPRSIQKKLHAAISSRAVRKVGGHEVVPIDARLIATTITPAGKLTEEGNILPETQEMFSVNVIELKPLRERREDIVPLVRHFLVKEAGPDHQITVNEESGRILVQYQWPGNVGELANAVKHAAQNLRDGVIVKDSLPGDIVAALHV